jgi:anaerobic ribonucleoside-triphosphate reductase activating protein
MTVNEIINVVEENGFNVTFSGGDPIYQAEALLPLAKELKQRGYTIWCYTGFLFEELLQRPHCPALLDFIDVVVDGPFQTPLRDISLRFKGSSNQRLIDVAQSRDGKITLWSDTF